MENKKFNEEELLKIKELQEKYSVIGIQLVQLKLAQKNAESYITVLKEGGDVGSLFGGTVVGVEIINTRHGLAARQQCLAYVAANETGGAGHKHRPAHRAISTL